MASVNTMNKGELRDCAEMVQIELQDLGIYPVYASRNSITYKFEDKRLGSLRISSHASGEYSYRWNLYSQFNKPAPSKYKTHWFPIQEADIFVGVIRSYQAVILTNAAKKEVPETEQLSPTEVELPPLSAYNDADMFYTVDSETGEITSDRVHSYVNLSQETIDKYQDDFSYLDHLAIEAKKKAQAETGR